LRIFEKAISWIPEPAAASRITPAGSAIGSICLALIEATDHGVDNLFILSLMKKEGSPFLEDFGSLFLFALVTSLFEGTIAVCPPSSTVVPVGT
jgi:hypothetical protein|tara:strand:- start:169 stop:450 length:282 start_codon:yes stop_codon:yes gene_type:complete